MVTRRIRLFAAATLVAGSMTALAVSAAAAVGPGTFTKITTPGGTTTKVFHPGGANALTVSGQTSLDVTSVDIDCVWYQPFTPNVAPVQFETFASSVPVTAGAFSVVAVEGQPTPDCRLRAIPTGVNLGTDYLGSYTGPIFYTDMLQVFKDGSHPFKFMGVGEEADGIAEMTDAAQCGIAASLTIETPRMEWVGPGIQNCAFWLPEGNVTSGSSTASSIKVDGNNAYLPYAVDHFLIHGRSILLTPTNLTTSFTRAPNGDVTFTESAELVRCSVSNLYPPTSVSCAPPLVDTGVKFTRVTNVVRGGHEVRVRDTYTSTDGHQHTVKPEYEGLVGAQATGRVGFMFPAHGSSFIAPGLNQSFTGFGGKAGTAFVRSDVYSVDGDGGADTVGLSWSRPPSEVLFGAADAPFGMPYSFTVPAGGNAYIGFAYTESLTTRATKSRAGTAVGEMVSTPTITKPANNATISGTSTTVKGTVALGANGLPTKVTVNGHVAHLTVNAAKTLVTYSVTFTESAGKHKITVTAQDSVGNTSSRSITVKNA